MSTNFVLECHLMLLKCFVTNFAHVSYLRKCASKRDVSTKGTVTSAPPTRRKQQERRKFHFHSSKLLRTAVRKSVMTAPFSTDWFSSLCGEIRLGRFPHRRLCLLLQSFPVAPRLSLSRLFPWPLFVNSST